MKIILDNNIKTGEIHYCSFTIELKDGGSRYYEGSLKRDEHKQRIGLIINRCLKVKKEQSSVLRVRVVSKLHLGYDVATESDRAKEAS